MSQHDGTIANADGATVRADIQAAVQAILTNSAGVAAPATTYANQWWADTTNALMKIRNAANSAWITIGPLSSFDSVFDGHGQCQLAFVSTVQIKLSPFNGDKIKIAGTEFGLPSAGVTLANTGLAASTLYYIYLYDNAGTLTLEASTTANATDTTAGNVGVEIKTGDATRTFVGSLTTGAGTPGIFVSADLDSWFNAPVVAGGKIQQIVNIQTGAVATGTTPAVNDDTIPQNTEGDEYMSLAVTPTSATSNLRIDVVWYGSASVNDRIGVALFQDSTASALAAVVQQTGLSSRGTAVSFSHFMTSGTTSATTFKVRAGLVQAGTTTFNGESGGRKLGGVAASSITITEVTS